MLMQNGILNLDKQIMASPSFRTIMEDGMVSEQELTAQSQTVIELLNEIDRRFTGEDHNLIERTLVETNVLYAIYKQYELQNIK